MYTPTNHVTHADCTAAFACSASAELAKAPPSEVPIVRFADNKGSNQLTRNEVLHKRSKYIRVSFQISRRMTKAGFTIFCFIPTKENIADLMTKSLARPTHTYLTNKIMFQFREGKLLDVLGNPVHFTPNAPVRDTLYLTVPAGLTPTMGDDVAPTQPPVPRHPGRCPFTPWERPLRTTMAVWEAALRISPR
jgi:hypothetical protein